MLVLPHLGKTCLWEDEAQTGLVARNILSQGVPAATDGKNSVSIFADHRDVRNGIHIWQGWFPSYLAAASMAVFGANAFGARFAFAAAFVGLIVFYYHFLKKRGDRNLHLWLTIFLTITCVPLLLHARQCRYYLLVPLLNLLIVDCYLNLLRQPSLRHCALLIVWTTLMLNSFFPGAVLLAIALGIDLIRRRPTRDAFKWLGIAIGITFVLNLPMAWFCRIWDRGFGVESVFSDPKAYGMYVLRYVLTLNNYFFPLVLVVAACAARWKSISRNAIFKGELSFLFVAVCVVQLMGFAMLADYPFTRYIIGIAPFLMFLAATCIESVAFGRSWLVWSLALFVAATNFIQRLPLPLLRQTSLQAGQWSTAGIDLNLVDPDHVRFSFARGEVKALINIPVEFPLIGYIRSIVRPPPGPDDLIVDYLRANAAPADRVKTSYGAETLMFHTNLTIINPTEIGPFGPEWMILRRFRPLKTSEEFMRESNKYPYTKITIPFPDLQWNNQPDPLYHYYERPPDDMAPPITILKKL